MSMKKMKKALKKILDERDEKRTVTQNRISSVMFIFIGLLLIGVGIFTMYSGFVYSSTIPDSYYDGSNGIVKNEWVPYSYALRMGSGGVFALIVGFAFLSYGVLGYLKYDRIAEEKGYKDN